MRNKIICVLLIIPILFSLIATPVSAAETAEYGHIQARVIETNEETRIKVMVNSGNVYVHTSFYEQLGFVVKNNDQRITIGNADNEELPRGAIGFNLKNTKCHRVNNAISEEYQAPFQSVVNDAGAWVPLEFSMYMLNGSLLLTSNGKLLISKPKRGVLDLLDIISAHHQNITFDYTKDFGYGTGRIAVLNGLNHFVNVFNGLLTFDGASWVSFLNTGSLNNRIWGDVGYDTKYGSSIARMVCTNSSEELLDAVDNVSTVNDLLSEDGTLNEIFSDLRDSNEKDLGKLYEKSREALDGIKKNNAGVSEYNRIYSQLEGALDQSTFLEIGDDISDLQTSINGVTTGLELLAVVAETIAYCNEFNNKDLFAVESLETFANSLPNYNGEVSFYTKTAMLQGANDFREDIVSYAVSRLIKENLDDILSEGLNLCAKANIALLTWDLASSLIPFLDEGLSAADKYELSVYAMCIQNESYRLYNEKLLAVTSSTANMTEENLKSLAQYAYAYLKLSYVTRNAAIGGISTLTSEGEAAAQMLIKDQQAVNGTIVPLLNLAKNSVNADAYACLGTSIGTLDLSSIVVIGQSSTLSTEAIYSEYRLIVEEYEQKYGELCSVPVNEYYSRIGGLCYLELVDFDNNGTEELLIAYDTDSSSYGHIIVDIWGVVDGNIEELYSLKANKSDQSGSFDITLVHKGDRTYFKRYLVRSYNGVMYFCTDLYTIVDGTFEVETSFEYEYIEGPDEFTGVPFYVNSVEYTQDEFFQIRNQWYEDTTTDSFGIYYVDHCRGRVNRVKWTIGLIDAGTDCYREMLLSLEYGEDAMEYTIYDIDKNGIPELIIKDRYNYDFFTCVDGEIKNCGSAYWWYANCLYEYGGNGLIVHDGGRGEDRFEFIYLYTLDDYVLSSPKTIMSSENSSYADIENDLDRHINITEFYPVTDLSLLAN